MSLPDDMVIEIFSRLKFKYTYLRCLNKKYNGIKLSWDGWDALIEQGVSVRITKYSITWTKYGMLRHRNGDLPAYTNIYGRKEWWKNGTLFRSDPDSPVIIHEDGREEYLYGPVERKPFPFVNFTIPTKYTHRYGSKNDRARKTELNPFVLYFSKWNPISLFGYAVIIAVGWWERLLVNIGLIDYIEW